RNNSIPYANRTISFHRNMRKMPHHTATLPPHPDIPLSAPHHSKPKDRVSKAQRRYKGREELIYYPALLYYLHGSQNE
ncbi:hypothetical protein, partial [Salmonella enterica]|uniref:hypothetical protein n=1 Tax=Salmonella enterica TaxID=28901 RepID=UPI003314CE8B